MKKATKMKYVFVRFGNFKFVYRSKEADESICKTSRLNLN